MSAPSVDLALAPELGETPSGSLVRAELRRLSHRRFIRWLVLLGAVGYLVILGIASTQYSKPTPELLAQAQQSVDQMIAEAKVYHAQCLKEVPAGEEPDSWCGPVPDAESVGDLDYFLPKQQFVMQNDFPDAAFGIGVLVAGFCFLVGATWIGAEWSQKTLMALLFWEPRRLKVFFTKIAVAVGGMALLAALAQLVWLGVGSYFASTKGISQVTDDFWSDTIALQGRCVLLAVLLGLIGFGLANLIRNTGAALGIGFVYFILELITMGIRPGWAVWALTVNVAALVYPGGVPVYIPSSEPTFDAEQGGLSYGREVIVSNWHGGLVIGGVALVLLVLGGWLFKRRDLT